MLTVKDIKKQYDSFMLDCSLEVQPGTVTGLVGQNGAGKSTTFKAILGLISIDSGEIKIDDKDSYHLQAKDKEKLGVVLSDSGFSGYLTIKDIIPILDALYSQFEKEEFIQLCKTLQLPFTKQIKEFSTGMKAKLKIIAAMTHHASLLILDEPTAGLDVIVRDEVLDMLRDYLAKNETCSILISSHISSDLEGLCDDIYIINQGEVILHEETDVLQSEYAIMKVSEEQYQDMDKTYIIKIKKESFGYTCLTNQKQFYVDNYPSIVIEKGNIDDVMIVMIKGESI